MIFTEPKCFSWSTKYSSCVSNVAYIENFTIDLLAYDSNACCGTTFIRVHHLNLLVYLQKHVFKCLIQIGLLIFLNFFMKLTNKSFWAMIRHMLPPMTVKDRKHSTFFISGQNVFMAESILHLVPELPIFVLNISVLLYRWSIFDINIVLLKKLVHLLFWLISCKWIVLTHGLDSDHRGECHWEVVSVAEIVWGLAVCAAHRCIWVVGLWWFRWVVARWRCCSGERRIIGSCTCRRVVEITLHFIFI